jgi:hypothetical protein
VDREEEAEQREAALTLQSHWESSKNDASVKRRAGQRRNEY